MAAWLPEPLLTNRLRLRPWLEEDAGSLAGLMADPEVRQYVGGPQPLDEARARAREQVAACTWGHFAVATRESDQLLGTLTFDRKREPWEVSFQLRRDTWGTGVMSEALSEAGRWFFESSTDDYFIAVTQAANSRARSLLQRAGATREQMFTYKEAEQVQYRFSRAVAAGCRFRSCSG